MHCIQSRLRTRRRCCPLTCAVDTELAARKLTITTLAALVFWTWPLLDGAAADAAPGSALGGSRYMCRPRLISCKSFPMPKTSRLRRTNSGVVCRCGLLLQRVWQPAPCAWSLLPQPVGLDDPRVPALAARFHVSRWLGTWQERLRQQIFVPTVLLRCKSLPGPGLSRLPRTNSGAVMPSGA
jgi:hypothetical protein